MTTTKIALNNAVPFQATHPGEILADELKARDIKKKDFAAQIGMQATHLSEILKGRRNITVDIAIKLEGALGIPYEHWMRLQNKYEYDCKSISKRTSEEYEAANIEHALSETFNLREIYKRLNISLHTCSERISALKGSYAFDLMQSPMQVVQSVGYFRRSDKLHVDEKNMRTWMVLARLSVSDANAECPYLAGNADMAAEEIARMANAETLSVDAIRACLNKHGIAYAEVPKLPQTPIDAYSVNFGGRPAIVVTYRCNDRDKLAFDVLHELGHISLHMNEERNAFISIDNGEYSASDPLERDANKYAQDHLIPRGTWERIMLAGCSDLSPHVVAHVIAKEAARHGISPSIAVSRYKHDSSCYNINSYRSPKIFS